MPPAVSFASLLALRALPLVALALSPLACSDDDGRGDTAPTGTSTPTGVTNTTEPGSSGSGGAPTTGQDTATQTGASQGSTTAATDALTGGPTTATSTTGTSATTGDATTTDATTTDATTTGVETACQRVDFLFVIDNSSSMEPEQTALKAAFPAFIATIMGSVSAQDYHIMVIDTDAAGKCTDAECAKGPDKNEVCNAYICNTEFDACDETLGAGVIHPAGKASSNEPCDIHGKNRYLVSEDPALTESFACVARLGLSGNGKERPLDAMVAALAKPINNAKGCNAGFLRDDAILVITIITDDPNKEDMTSPVAAYEAVVAAKNGDTDRIVVLGLIPDATMGCPADKPAAGVHWANFVSKFGERGVKAPVCVADYNTFFQEAVAIIDQTCIINPG
jgi:hypothetical protein